MRLTRSRPTYLVTLHLFRCRATYCWGAYCESGAIGGSGSPGGYASQMTTVTEGRRPTPLSRVWSGTKTIAEDLTGDDLGDVLELHSDASAWWVLNRDEPLSAEVRDVARALDLDDLALKDLLATDGRAKHEEMGQARLVITNAVTVDAEGARVTTYPISIIATDRALICLADPCPDFQPAQLLSSKDELLARGGVEAGLQALLGAVVHTYQTAVDWLEQSSDDLSDLLFDTHVLNKPQQLHTFRLRKALSELRRATEPMRTVLGDLRTAQPPVVKGKPARDKSIDRRWVILDEQHDRIADAADRLRETLSSVFDTSLALNDIRLNQTMKKLTGWAAILAVPTLVTSFVGMNVTFPLEGTAVGFWVYLVVMVAAGGVLYAAFKARDWV
jgi:magnesium transporter